MLCCVLLYVFLCLVILCCITWCCILLRCVEFCCVLLSFVMCCCILLCFDVLYCVVLCCVVLWCVILRFVVHTKHYTFIFTCAFLNVPVVFRHVVGTFKNLYISFPNVLTAPWNVHDAFSYATITRAPACSRDVLYYSSIVILYINIDLNCIKHVMNCYTFRYAT